MEALIPGQATLSVREPKRDMKILLQNTKTGLYHTPTGEWDRDLDSALAFPSFRNARDYIKTRQLAKTKLVALAGGSVSQRGPGADPSKAKWDDLPAPA